MSMDPEEIKKLISANTGLNREERDLLIELRTEMAGVRCDIRDLRDNTGGTLKVLEAENRDQNSRLTKLETKSNNYNIVMGLYTTFTVGLVGLLLWHIFGK